MVGQSSPVSFPEAIVKRGGTRLPFDAERIRLPILKAGRASGSYDVDEACRLCGQVVRVLGYRYPAGAPEVEQIQHTVEHVLISAGHIDTARAYIAYRDQHQRLRAGRRTQVASRAA